MRGGGTGTAASAHEGEVQVLADIMAMHVVEHQHVERKGGLKPRRNLRNLRNLAALLKTQWLQGAGLKNVPADGEFRSLIKPLNGNLPVLVGGGATAHVFPRSVVEVHDP